MAQGFLHGISDDPNLEKQIEKQMGCMAGFLQMFDRHQFLAGKRLHSTKMLVASPKSNEITAKHRNDSLVKTVAVPAPPSPVGNGGSTAFNPNNARAVPVLRREQHQSYLHHQQQQQPRSSLDSRDVVRDSFCKEPVKSLDSCNPTVEKKLNNALTKTPPGPGIQIPAGSPLSVQPLPLPVLEFNDSLGSSLKFREAPRLSLDSRAVVDQKGSLYPREIRTRFVGFPENRHESSGQSFEESEENEKQRRSPSVVARLMGLDALPDCGNGSYKKAELRRSASESRASRDLPHYRFIDGNGFPFKQSINSGNNFSHKNETAVAEERNWRVGEGKLKTWNPSKLSSQAPMEFHVKMEPRKASNEALPWNLQQRTAFDSQDFFPEPKRTGMFYGEIERRLKMRGIDESAKDLETLKQILEALQLKGLLHSCKSDEQGGYRSFVHDRKFSPDAIARSPESPIVVMRPTSCLSKRSLVLPVSPVSRNRPGGNGNESPPLNYRFRGANCRGFNNPAASAGRESSRRNLTTDILLPVRTRRERPELDRKLQKEARIWNPRTLSESVQSNADGLKSPSSLNRRRTSLNVETQRKPKNSGDQRSFSGQSPKSAGQTWSKKVGSDSPSKSPRIKKQTVEISSRNRHSDPIAEEPSTDSETSHIETGLQISKIESKEGRSPLDRCDKLLQSIEEVTEQPSPVSVLDSSFYKDDSSPSSVMNRSIDFKENQSAEQCEHWNPAIGSIEPKSEWILPIQEEEIDEDFIYVTEILQNSGILQNPLGIIKLPLRKCDFKDSDTFLRIDQQRKAGLASKLHRKLIFDTVTEILQKKKLQRPWKSFTLMKLFAGKTLFKQIWTEFQRLREPIPAVDICEIVCGVLHKDVDDPSDGWKDQPVEFSDAILDIERLIYKDLVAETIRELAVLAGKWRAPRRQLLFE